jgi:hypothetical protein
LGEVGLGEMGLGEVGLGEMGLGGHRTNYASINDMAETNGFDI